MPSALACASPFRGSHAGPWGIAVILTILSLTPPGGEVTAAEDPGEEVQGDAPAEETLASKQHWSLWAIDFTHKILSQGVEYGARGMDSFFTTEETLTDTTSSFVKVSIGPRWREEDGGKLAEDLRARLDLPGTQHQLKLFLGQGSLAEEEDEEIADAPREEGEGIRRRGFGLGLEGQLRPTRVGRAQWQFLPAVGVKVRIPPDPFIRFRVTRRANYGPWRSRWSATLAQFLGEGFLSRTRLDWDRRLNQYFIFRSGTRLEWTLEEDVVGARERFTLFHKLTPDNRMAYEAQVRSDDDPEWQVENYFLQVRYRNRFYKKWLFFELRPRLSWPRDNGFEPRWSVLLRFEAIFGYYAIPEEDRGKRSALPVFSELFSGLMLSPIGEIGGGHEKA